MVYQATQLSLNREVALKSFIPSGAIGLAAERQRERFLREARILAQAGYHESIVKVHDVARSEDGASYIVMEFVRGENLLQAIARESPPSVRELAGIVAEAARALHFAHGLGIVHRDIKPANLMIDGRGRVKVLDFGIAVSSQEGRQTLQAIGTPEYMAPEQFRNDPEIGPSADVYSLSATLFESICGRPPFIDTNPYALANKHMFDAPPRPSATHLALPVEFDEIVGSGMNKEPSGRFVTAKALADAIDDLIGRKGDYLASLRPLRPGALAAGDGLEGVSRTYAIRQAGGSSGFSDSHVAEVGSIARMPDSLQSNRWGVGLVALLLLVGAAVGGAWSVRERFGPRPDREDAIKGTGESRENESYGDSPQREHAADHAPAHAVPIRAVAGSSGRPQVPMDRWGVGTPPEEPNNPLHALDVSVEADLVAPADRDDRGAAKSPHYAPDVATSDLAGESSDSLYSQGLRLYRSASSLAAKTSAFTLFRQAALRGHAGAMNSMAICYERGDGVAQDADAALEWFEKSAESGSLVGMTNLGVRLVDGTLGKRDAARSFELFNKAAKANFPPAISRVGECYLNGWGGAVMDKERAVGWFRSAAQRGDTTGMTNLATCYERGEGVARSLFQAKYWYQRAAEGGSAAAKRRLAQMAGE